MVLDFFKLAEQPFGVTPDPRYLYFSASHREAMASALYGISTGRGFTALIAQPGMGKTTLLFDLLHKIRNHARTVFLFQPQSDPRDLLRCVLADLGIDDDGADFVRMNRKLNEMLVAESRRGRRLVVVLDEAQNLDDHLLEAVRMLSNFETPREKLMHLVLAGQPHLADKLRSAHLIQLRQRISIISRLKPFNEEETEHYIAHRLKVAGYGFPTPMFTPRAIEIIAKYTQGIPRNINNVCFNAMSLAFVTKQQTIDERIVWEVITDLDLHAERAEPVRAPAKILSDFPDATRHKPIDERTVWVVDDLDLHEHPDSASGRTGAETEIPEVAATPIAFDRPEWTTSTLRPEESSRTDAFNTSTAETSLPAPAHRAAAAASVGGETGLTEATEQAAMPKTLPAAEASRESRVGVRSKHAKRKMAMPHKLTPQVLLTGLLVVTLGWIGIQAKRRIVEAHTSSEITNSAEKAPTDIKSAVTPSINSGKVAAPGSGGAKVVDAEREPGVDAATDFIEVLADDTLAQISKQAFGKYDEETLAMFRKVNPWLSDPDHIKAGQQIRIPRNVESSGIFPTTESASSALSVGAER
jgi:general secretion pathway protein A